MTFVDAVPSANVDQPSFTSSSKSSVTSYTRSSSTGGR